MVLDSVSSSYSKGLSSNLSFSSSGNKSSIIGVVVMGASLEIVVMEGSEGFSVTSTLVVGSDETISGVVVSVTLILVDSEVEFSIAKSMYFRKIILRTAGHRKEKLLDVLEIISHSW